MQQNRFLIASATNNTQVLCFVTMHRENPISCKCPVAKERNLCTADWLRVPFKATDMNHASSVHQTVANRLMKTDIVPTRRLRHCKESNSTQYNVSWSSCLLSFKESSKLGKREKLFSLASFNQIKLFSCGENKQKFIRRIHADLSRNPGIPMNTCKSLLQDNAR